MTAPTYRDLLTAAMTALARDHPTALFLGQAVEYEGTSMFATLAGVPPAQRLELPVFENTQLGLATGLALSGSYLPVCLFPRINFLLCAMDQLVLHLDALPRLSVGGFQPKVLIRTAVASGDPPGLDPGPQHLGDYTAALRQMLQTVRVIDLLDKAQIAPAYAEAAARAGATLLVEHHALYDT